VIATRVEPGPLAAAYERACRQLEGFADGLWARRASAFATDIGAQQKIAARLGWVSATDFITPHCSRLRSLAGLVREAGFTDVVLLGMGGSSLAAEVFQRVLGAAPGYPRFTVLDSVDPHAVRQAMSRAGTTLFILASKSGTTIEVDALAAEARRSAGAAGHRDFGSRAIAITDDGTVLHARATADGFLGQYINPSDIGGRYSALSLFGMVPAALMGIDLDAVVASARAMESACRAPAADDNPGLSLGALMATGSQHGRDKLTLLLPDALRPFGTWIEQLVAESTGKQGKGVVPIVDDPIDASWGDDRLVIIVNMENERPDPRLVEKARAASTPGVTLDVSGRAAIGAEFMRWQVATAAAGALMGVNPFDEPNVQQAKDATRTLLDRYRQHGRLPIPEAHARVHGARLTLTAEAASRLGGASALSFLDLIQRGDYFGNLVYLPPDNRECAPILEEFRTAIASSRACATTTGFGPRYLHSTGQLHKGGPDTGVFLLVTAEPDEDLPIPDWPLSFGVLEMAQAIGDFDSLDKAGRRALHLHLPARDPDLLRRATGTLLAGVS
jgi:glucose-6-phosphate isomerase